jgi:hypothetical protein
MREQENCHFIGVVDVDNVVVENWARSFQGTQTSISLSSLSASSACLTLSGVKRTLGRRERAAIVINWQLAVNKHTHSQLFLPDLPLPWKWKRSEVK